MRLMLDMTRNIHWSDSKRGTGGISQTVQTRQGQILERAKRPPQGSSGLTGAFSAYSAHAAGKLDYSITRLLYTRICDLPVTCRISSISSIRNQIIGSIDLIDGSHLFPSSRDSGEVRVKH